MSDKRVLGQFHAKISKAKIIFNSTTQANQRLNKQANQLHRQYMNLKKQRQIAEQWQNDSKQQAENAQALNKQENNTCENQTNHLKQLRKQKKQHQLQKTILETQLDRLNAQLEQLINKRTQLQATEKSLSEKLSNVSAERDVLYQENLKTKAAIDAYTANINNLNEEIRQMKQVITENTVPIHKKIQSKNNQSHVEETQQKQGEQRHQQK